jgi:hypothetical protein
MATRCKITEPKKREELASKLQAMLTAVGPLYSELMALDGDLELEWPFGRPYGFSTIDRHSVDREIGWLLHGLVHEHGLPSVGLKSWQSLSCAAPRALGIQPSGIPPAGP